MLSSVNRDHWNERLNFTGGAMMLKPFPPVVIFNNFALFGFERVIIKTPDQNTKKQRKNLANPHCQPSWAYTWSITHTIRPKTKQYCQATFHGDKKNDK